MFFTLAQTAATSTATNHSPEDQGPAPDQRRHKGEIEFLLQHRVELNAFASDQLVEWIEEKLVEHGVKKVAPEEDTLARATRGFARDLIAKRYLDKFADDIDRDIDAAVLALNGLSPAVMKMLEEDPALAWDNALAEIMQTHIGPPRT